MKSLLFGLLFIGLAIADFMDGKQMVVLKFLPFIPISPLLLIFGIVLSYSGARSLIGSLRK